MKMYLLLALSFISLLQAKDTLTLPKKINQFPKEIIQLASKFKILKKQKDPIQNKWNSELYKTMDNLNKFQWKDRKLQSLINLLGLPDSQKGNKNYKSYESFVKLNQGEEFIVYEWRGAHDFLYFIYSEKTGKILKWDWWMAFE